MSEDEREIRELAQRLQAVGWVLWGASVTLYTGETAWRIRPAKPIRGLSTILYKTREGLRLTVEQLEREAARDVR